LPFFPKEKKEEKNHLWFLISQLGERGGDIPIFYQEKMGKKKKKKGRRARAHAMPRVNPAGKEKKKPQRGGSRAEDFAPF